MVHFNNRCIFIYIFIFLLSLIYFTKLKYKLSIKIYLFFLWVLTSSIDSVWTGFLYDHYFLAIIPSIVLLSFIILSFYKFNINIEDLVNEIESKKIKYIQWCDEFLPEDVLQGKNLYSDKINFSYYTLISKLISNKYYLLGNIEPNCSIYKHQSHIYFFL